MLITLDAGPDKLLRDKPNENYWALFEVVGFLLSARLTTAHEDRRDRSKTYIFEHEYYQIELLEILHQGNGDWFYNLSAVKMFPGISEV